MGEGHLELGVVRVKLQAWRAEVKWFMLIHCNTGDSLDRKCKTSH